MSENTKIQNMVMASPLESKELAMKKASSFKDPSKLDASEVLILYKVEHIKYSTLGKKQLTSLLRPNIITSDLSIFVMQRP